LTDAQTPDEEQERRYLAETIQVLTTELESLSDSIDDSARTIEEQKAHMWTHRRDMDSAEKASMRTAMDMSVALAEHAVMRRKRIERLLESPYFGRVNFHRRGDAGPETFYIGVHNFSDPETQEIWVHDWRAPVSSLYYDFESGEAFFEAPAGTTHGEITGKRQYKIQGGRLEFMFESTLTIGDDVLQRELSQSSRPSSANRTLSFATRPRTC